MAQFRVAKGIKHMYVHIHIYKHIPSRYNLDKSLPSYYTGISIPFKHLKFEQLRKKMNEVASTFRQDV